MIGHRLSNFAVFIVAGLLGASANAADIRVVPTPLTVVPDEIVQICLEVLTQPGDNTIGFGYYAFSIDLTFTGSLSLPASAISDVTINSSVFSNQSSYSLGQASGNQLLGIGAATADLVSPNPGSSPGDVVRLFDFSLTIPAGAVPGSTVTITPSEGASQIVALTPSYDQVAPQSFSPITLIVVPEPASLGLLAFVVVTVSSVRRRKFANHEI